MAEFTIRSIRAEDHKWIRRLIRERWAGEFVIVHGTTFHPAQLPGFLAEAAGRNAGLLTCAVTPEACEIVTLDSLSPGRGIGTALVDAARELAARKGCRRLFAVTTNDNLHALRFYQRRGFVLAALRPNAVDQTRKRKPIPLRGENGIPIRDELELELLLE
ncbi:MAG: GNAT family N-acetyltransferase [Anaerolineales bacterium]